MKINYLHLSRHLLAAIAILNLVLNFSPTVLAHDGRQPTLRVGYLPGDIKLDGLLDEPEWAAADSIENLTMVEPDEGVPPTAATIVKVLANSNEVVFGIDCKDPEPEGIVSFSKSRDAHFRQEDHILLVLDTFRDGRSGYVFAVNPGGARYDALVADRGERENSNWDDAWEAATSRNDSGWCVEVRLPIRSINYKAGLRTWGFNIQRRVQRLQETSRWASPQQDIEITQTFRAGLLTNLPDFELGWGLSVRPSVVGGGGSYAPDEPFQSERDVSLDVKQLWGPNLTASLTVNTDFAETEVDVRQTNLTRFPLFFPEKRTFFLEGADIFDFGIGLWRDVIPFFSRRIGLLEEQEVPLIIGGKINGRVGGSNIGALAVRTDDVSGLAPKTTLGVVRIQQNILDESSVGMIATFGDPQGLEGSWLAGADFTYQTSSFQGDKNFLVGVWGLAVNRSDLAGDKTAVGFKVDYPNDLWDLALTYKRIGDDFDPSLGFVPRAGVQIIHVGMQYNPRPRWRWLRQMFHQLRLRVVTDLDSQWETYRAFTAPLNWLLESGDRFEFNIVPEGDKLLEPFEIADGVIINVGTFPACL
ncbi:MAG: DUF5916 domain-containing protein, partial [Candidatus Zixiibacteriota bacterium]